MGCVWAVTGEPGPPFLIQLFLLNESLARAASRIPRSAGLRVYVGVLSLVSLLLPDAQECPTGASRPERRAVDSFAAKIRAWAARIFGAVGA